MPPMFSKTTQEAVCKKSLHFDFRNPLRLKDFWHCLQKHTQMHISFVATVPIQLQEHQFSEMKRKKLFFLSITFPFFFSLKGFFSQQHTYVLDNNSIGSAISKPWHSLIFICGQVESVFLTELSWHWDLIHTGLARGVVARVVWGQNNALWTRRPASTWSWKKQIKVCSVNVLIAKTSKR